MSDQKRKIGAYVRVSRVGGREGDSFQSPATQEKMIRADAPAHSEEVVVCEHELDQSGGTMARPKLQRLIAEIRAGRLDGIVVARLDRFARTLVGGVAAIEEIHEAGGYVRTVEGGIDTSRTDNAMGQLQLNLLLSLAQWERATRAEGFEVAKANAVERGVHIVGRVPVGYRRAGKGQPLAIDPETAPTIAAAFRLRATGAPYSEICHLLDELLPGGPSGRGCWNKQTVARLLANRAYLGEARQGRHFRADSHEAIVDGETFDTVHALATKREPRRDKRTRTLLGGLVRCGGCGYALERTAANGGTSSVYRCSGRHATGVCIERASAMLPALDQLVEDRVVEILQAKALDVQRVRARRDVAGLHARIAAAREKRVAFEDPDYVSALGLDAAKRALSRVDDEIAKLEALLVAAVGENHDDGLDVETAIARWASLATEEKREIVGSMIESVIVSQAPRGTALADRIEIRARLDAPTALLPAARDEAVVEARIASA